MTNGANVCCPFFQTMVCGDSDDHRHLCCGAQKGLITNDTAKVCISESDWETCIKAMDNVPT